MEKSVHKSPIASANSENLFDSEVSFNELQSHDGQLPRNAGKGEKLVLTRLPTKLSTSTISLNAGILKTTRKRKENIQVGRHPT